jgi:hypothetical protein
LMLSFGSLFVLLLVLLSLFALGMSYRRTNQIQLPPLVTRPSMAHQAFAERLSGAGELTLVLFPHCGREAFAQVLAKELSHYLATIPERRFLVVGLQQIDTPNDLRTYCKGLSWNVGLHWLRSAGADPNLAVALQDVDAVPRQNVSYDCPAVGHADVWWMTTGGIKGRFGDFYRVNGYPVSAKGWGREDHDFWLRLQRAGVHLREWPATLQESDPAIVLNLEWATEREEPFLRQHYWTRWLDKVHTVSQQNQKWGLKTTVPVPRKSWFSLKTFEHNRCLSDAINSLDESSYWAYVHKDGITSLRFLTEPRLNSFFESVQTSPNIMLLNLTFSLSDVEVTDPIPTQQGD